MQHVLFLIRPKYGRGTNALPPRPMVPTALSSSAAPCTLSELIRSKNVGSWNVDEATLDWKKT